MSIEDWDNLTMNGAIMDEEGCLEFEEFQRAIRWQLMIYGQRMLGQRMKQVQEFGPYVLVHSICISDVSELA